MRRAAICGAIAVVLAAAAVAVGAGTDVRIHRLHVPPPPVGDDTGTSVPPAPGKANPTNPTDPSVPGTSPPAAPPPAGAQPPPPPASPPPGVVCTVAGDTPGANVTGTLSDYAIALSASSVAAAPTLTFRGTYPAGGDIHNLALIGADSTKLCGTNNLNVGQAGTFTVTNLPPGNYQLVCTIHAAFGMTRAFTVN